MPKNVKKFAKMKKLTMVHLHILSKNDLISKLCEANSDRMILRELSLRRFRDSSNVIKKSQKE